MSDKVTVSPTGGSDIESCAVQHGRLAGAPAAFGLLPHVPISYSPLWNSRVSASVAVSNLARNLEGVCAVCTPVLWFLWRTGSLAAFYSFGTPYSTIPGHRAHNLIPEALRDVELDPSRKSGSPESSDTEPASAAVADPHVIELVSDLAADLQPIYLRFFGLVLSPLFEYAPLGTAIVSHPPCLPIARLLRSASGLPF